MTTLTGTEKQIAWANDIRAKMLKAMEQFCADTIARYNQRNDSDRAKVIEQLAEIKQGFESLISDKDSKWFIDNRYDAPLSIRSWPVWTQIVAEVQKARSAK